MVGIDKSRFIRAVLPQEMLCKVCDNVLLNPVQCFKCKIWNCQSCSQNA